MTSTQHALRSLAIQQDAAASSSLDLALFWEGLCQGAWLFCDTFSTSERCYAVVRDSKPPRALDTRKLALLEAVLLGTPPKVVALERSRSLSSITTAIQDCLRTMGLACRASHTPVLLTMAATALHRCNLAHQSGRLSRLELAGESYVVVSALRPDRQFPVPLSLAEAAVVRCLIAGQTHAQISGERATSRRTVANQLWDPLESTCRHASLSIL